jgi:hypothetical protein
MTLCAAKPPIGPYAPIFSGRKTRWKSWQNADATRRGKTG